MALKVTEQPQEIRGQVTESSTNTLTVTEIAIPRILSTQELFDADQIRIMGDVQPIRTTTGIASHRIQLVLSEKAPTALLADDDAKLVAQLWVTSLYNLRESAAGVFTVQKVGDSVHQNKDGHVDSTRWRNFLPDDKIWLVTHSEGATTVSVATVRILGKLDKSSDADFKALILSRL